MKVCATSRTRSMETRFWAPGAMRAVSRPHVPTAVLSRQTAGVRGSALIVNLPGQPKAIGECLDAVFPAIPYCVDLIGGPYLTTNEERIKAFRPKSAKKPAV